MNKRILLTGSRGFTGEYISAELESKGYDVIGLVQSNSINKEVVCDLTDKAALIDIVNEVKPDGAIHLAALSFVGHEDESAFYAVNTVGTTNFLEALYRCGRNYQKVIVASSANIYGNPSVKVITEETEPGPVNHYAASKLAMEYMVKTYFHKLPIVMTRPFNYTGIGQDPKFLIPKIVNHYRENKKTIELGNLDVARDFSDVRDIARAYVGLYESDVASDVFNLSSGKVYQLKEIIELMNEIAGYEIEVKVNPAFVRDNEIKVLCGNNDKLKAAIGHQDKYSLKDSLHDMFSK